MDPSHDPQPGTDGATALLDSGTPMSEPVWDSSSAALAIEPSSPVATSVPGNDAKPSPPPWKDWLELSKPRIVTMILVTTIASAWIAMGTQSLPPSFGFFGWCVLLLGTGFIAGSAGAANQIWERRIDRFMPRTASRPLPGERISTAAAILATGGCLIAGLAALYFQFSVWPAAVGLATWVLYVLIYTPMKTRTAWNTTVGAVAGALPVFMGYTAAGGDWFEPAGWMLFGVLAFWQYPHFMAIAWLYRHQYGQAGFQMTTTIDPTGRHAGWQSIVGSVCLLACGLFVCFVPVEGLLVFSPASVLTAVLVTVASYPLIAAAVRFSRAPGDLLARKMLRWSLVVLPAVLLVMTLRVVF